MLEVIREYLFPLSLALFYGKGENHNFRSAKFPLVLKNVNNVELSTYGVSGTCIAVSRFNWSSRLRNNTFRAFHFHSLAF